MFRTEAGENRRGALPQVAGRAGHFPLLIEHACVEFDLRADCALVVVERLQGDAHPVVLIAALIPQDNRPAAELCHNQIRIAVPSDVRNRDRARLIELHRIEMHIPGYVGPALAPQIPQ